MLTRYENAQVFTADGRFAESFVVKDGRFAFVGGREDARNAFPQAKAVDLSGCFVCPGFNDSHMHLLELGCMLGQAQLASDSLAGVLDALARFAADHPREPFILGRGFNDDHFLDERRYLTRGELDAVCPDRPCLITRVCGHVAIANSRALELAGLSNAAVPVEGGHVDVDALGRPTGVLRENAISLVSSLIPVLDRQGIRERLLLALRAVRRYGITSVQTDDFADLPFEDVIAVYRALANEGKLTARVTEQSLLPTQAELTAFLQAGYTTGWGDERFRIGPLKLIGDGSLGSRTAFLRAPYTDDPQTCGIVDYTQEALDALVLQAHRAGMQVAVHAIGDGACDRVLNAVEHAQAVCPRRDARHGIVHAQITDRQQVARMAALGMHAYIQPIFLDYDAQIVRSRVGSRAEEAYPAASLLLSGATLSSGSDSPVEPPDVLAGIQCAVTRRGYLHPGDAPYLPHEALSLSDALRSFTSFGAYASFEEHIKGRIAPGFLADFTVLGQSPFETAPQALHAIPVTAVFLGGEKL